MRVKSLLFVLAVALAPLLCAPFAPAAPAQIPNPSNVSLTVSPSRLELKTSRSSVVTATIEVFNTGNVAKKLSVVVRDFVPQGEDGRARLLPAATSPWSMSSWISVKPKSFRIKPNERVKTEIRIAVPPDGEPGGHYAAILYSTAPDGPGQTRVVAQVGALALLDVAGKVAHAARAELAVPRVIEGGDVPLNVRFSNDGNVHVKPSGLITVDNVVLRRSQEVTITPENVLPRSARVFVAQWKDAEPGLYLLRATFAYSDAGRVATSRPQYLVVFPWRGALGIVGVFILGVLAATVFNRRGRRPDSAQKLEPANEVHDTARAS